MGLSDGAAIEQVNVETGVTQVVMPQGGSASVVRALNERGWDTIYAILNPTSSPSGKYIAALAQTNGGSVPVVTDSAGSFVAAGVPNPDAQAMAWNPTEDVLAYSTGVLIPPSPAQNDWTVELLTPSNGTNRRLAELTSTDELILGLEWSPDGTVLAVNGSRIENQDLVVLLEARTGVVLDRVPIDSEIPASLIDWGPA
ncbi:MAG: hypothetical protein H0W97_05180 [Actinobacteria bacterium]|nr:hypothetical protein [Actinomycetota bacterium]